MFALACIALSTAPTSLGLRLSKSAGGVSASPGLVEEIYTFGTPAGTKPSLKNHAKGSDGCLPGLRVVSAETILWGSTWVYDPIPSLPRWVGYEASNMDYMAYDINTNKLRRTPCSKKAYEKPAKLEFHNPLLHLQYPNPGQDGLLGTMFLFGYQTSWEHDIEVVKEEARSEGWGLVHSAWHKGEQLEWGGLQVSHLLQHPESLECTVTFQGTKSLEDVITDIAFKPSKFCGLPEQVHLGFRNHLRRIVTSDDWQDNIRAHLPSCSKVYVTGISLGGVMSELFTACNSNAPGDDKDYKYFSWDKGTPNKLPYIESLLDDDEIDNDHYKNPFKNNM